MWNSLETWSHSTEVWYGVGVLLKQSRTRDIYTNVIVNFNSCIFEYWQVAVSGLQNQDPHKLIFHFWVENMYQTTHCN